MYMRFDGGDGDTKLVRDLRIRMPGEDQISDLDFPGRHTPWPGRSQSLLKEPDDHDELSKQRDEKQKQPDYAE